MIIPYKFQLYSYQLSHHITGDVTHMGDGRLANGHVKSNTARGREAETTS